MATATKPAKADTSEGPEEGKKKGGKGKIIKIAVVLLLVLGLAWFFFLKPEGAKPPPKPGEVVVMDKVTINLADAHYLSLKLSLQAVYGAYEPPDGSKALDIAVDALSDKEVAEISGKGRTEIKEKLTEKIIEEYHDEVMDVYFTEFVIQ